MRIGSPMPGDLAEQVPWVHEACEALGVPIYTAPGFEADDVIGTLATKAAAAGMQAAIVTGDKDFFQLVGGPIRVYNPRDEGTWYDEEGVLQKFGVKPSQVGDVLAEFIGERQLVGTRAQAFDQAAIRVQAVVGAAEKRQH